MRFFLVQHGEACAKDVDPERPLTPRGRQDVEGMAEFLGRAGVSPGRVVHSGKLRAAQTAEILATRLAPGASLNAMDGLTPNDDPAAIDWPSEGANGPLMVVGHLPFMARLVALLVSGDADRPITDYQPGSMVCLDEADDGTWRIAWMLRPELLA